MSDDESNGVIDRFDERDEDEEKAREDQGDSADSADGRGSPHTSDSETVPHDQPTPTVPRRNSYRRKDGDSGLLGPDETGGDAPYLPYSILSPDSHSLESGEGAIGRRFPWGFADPYNPDHCDFTRLKESCFGEWRAELREASKEIWYERWRTSRLNRQGQSMAGTGGLNGIGGEGRSSHASATATASSRADSVSCMPVCQV